MHAHFHSMLVEVINHNMRKYELADYKNSEYSTGSLLSRVSQSCL